VPNAVNPAPTRNDPIRANKPGPLDLVAVAASAENVRLVTNVPVDRMFL